MDLQPFVLPALQLSVVLTVFGFGLQASPGDLLYVVRRPGLVARSLLAIYVCMPAAAVGLGLLFRDPHPVVVVMVALAISPVPPLLPAKLAKAGGDASYGLGLIAVSCLTAVIAAPFALEILTRGWGSSRVMPPAAIAIMVAKTTLAPLLAGMAARAAWPRIAAAIEQPVSVVSGVLLPLGVIVLVGGSFPALWAAATGGSVLALAVFTLAGLLIGHLLGGPHREQSVVLALATASRHPAIALAIAAANFPEQKFGPLILLYLLVNGIAALPYIRWMRKRTAHPTTQAAPV